jgi:hypothetical protein
MSTLADELLQDFEDSGSEGEEQQNGGLFADEEDSKAGLNGHASTLTGADGGGMELDGDEEEVDEDKEMAVPKLLEGQEQLVAVLAYWPSSQVVLEARVP